MITLERCRSHNVNNNPHGWEAVAQHRTAESAIRDLWDYSRTCRASGDQFRLTVGGVEQIVVDSDTLVPMESVATATC